MSELSTEEMVVHFDPTEEGAGGVSAAAAGGAGGAQELGRRLLAAARDGHSTAVLDLMAQGAPFTTDWLGTSPLHLAAANNQVNVCAVLLRAGASRDCRTKVDRTPLHLAAYWGHADVCDLLLRRGAQVMARDMLRMTPLHWAAERGHAAAAGVLLRAGADTEALSKFGATPRTLALAAGRQDLLRLMDEPRDPPHQDTEEAHDESAQAAEYVAMEELDGIPYTKLPEQAEEAPEDTSGAEETDGDGASTGRVESGAARLLRRHGITMLPAEPPGTALRALQAGRTILLSDAGKLMLKESVAETSPAPPSPSSPPGGGEGEGVVLTATPVTSPPRGVKVFTIGNKLAKDHKMQGIKKVQYVSVTGGGGRAPKPLKILVNKHNLERLLTTAKGPAPAPASPAPVPPPPPPPDPADEAVVRVPEQFLRSTDPSYLRAQLLAATAALHRATRQLAQLRATSQRH